MAVDVRKALFGTGRQQQPAARHAEKGQERHAGARAAGRTEQAERRALTGSRIRRGPSRRPTSAPRGTGGSRHWRLSRSTGGRDRPQGAEPAEHRGRSGAERAGSAVVVERLGEQHVVVDVPAQRRRGGSGRRTRKLGRGAAGACAAGVNVAAAGSKEGGSACATGSRSAACWGESTAEGPGSGDGGGSGADVAGSGEGTGSGGGGGSGTGVTSGTGVGSIGGIRRRRLAGDRRCRPPARLPRASSRTRAPARPAAVPAAAARMAMGVPTWGLGRTTTSTERHLHLIGHC